MSEKLSRQRGNLIPRPRFSFKSRKAFAPMSPPSRPLTLNQYQSLTFENYTGKHLSVEMSQLSTSTVMDVDDLHLGDLLVEIASLKDVTLTNLIDCSVNLVHDISLRTIHIRSLERCIVVIPPASGGILLHGCEGCVIIGACHQVTTRISLIIL